jgi:flagellar protein FlaF
MGVSQAVAFSLIAVVALSSFMTVTILYQRSQQVYDDAVLEYHAYQLASMQTQTHIVRVTVSSTKLYVYVANNGSTNLYDYQHFALVVDYYGNVSGAAVHSVSDYSYTSAASPGAYQWTSVDGMLYAGGTAQFLVVLPYPPYNGEPATVVVSTNYGPFSVWRGTL